MAVQITELTPSFAGEVSGVDLTKPLTPEEAAAIEDGMDRLAVLVFHDQFITDEQQLAFSKNFGAIEVPDKKSNITKDKDRRRGLGMADVSNLDKSHKPMQRADRQRLFNLGNRLWHSDSSFRATPSKFSLLSGRVVPDAGGNTDSPVRGAGHEEPAGECGVDRVAPRAVVGPVLREGTGPAGDPYLTGLEPHAEMMFEVVESPVEEFVVGAIEDRQPVAAE